MVNGCVDVKLENSIRESEKVKKDEETIAPFDLELKAQSGSALKPNHWGEY